MLETSNEVDEEKYPRRTLSLSRYPNASLPSARVDTSDKNDTSLMIEAE